MPTRVVDGIDPGKSRMEQDEEEQEIRSRSTLEMGFKRKDWGWVREVEGVCILAEATNHEER